MAWNWGISIIAFAFGLGIGFAVAYLIIPRSGRIQALEKDLTDSKTQFKDYRGKVNQHFQRTAELFDDMTERYRAVYQHMASSAQSLCEERPASLSLDLNSPGRLSHGGTAAEDTETSDEHTPGQAPTQSAQAGRTSASRAPDTDRDDDEDAFGDAPRVPELHIGPHPDDPRKTTPPPGRDSAAQARTKQP